MWTGRAPSWLMPVRNAQRLEFAPDQGVWIVPVRIDSGAGDLLAGISAERPRDEDGAACIDAWLSIDRYRQSVTVHAGKNAIDRLYRHAAERMTHTVLARQKRVSDQGPLFDPFLGHVPHAPTTYSAPPDA
jgi:hypothetical protein